MRASPMPSDASTPSVGSGALGGGVERGRRGVGGQRQRQAAEGRQLVAAGLALRDQRTRPAQRLAGVLVGIGVVARGVAGQRRLDRGQHLARGVLERLEHGLQPGARTSACRRRRPARACPRDRARAGACPRAGSRARAPARRRRPGTSAARTAPRTAAPAAPCAASSAARRGCRCRRWRCSAARAAAATACRTSCRSGRGGAPAAPSS